MNKCENYDIECPYALVVWDELPCSATQEQCDNWRRKRKKCGKVIFTGYGKRRRVKTNKRWRLLE